MCQIKRDLKIVDGILVVNKPGVKKSLFFGQVGQSECIGATLLFL